MGQPVNPRLFAAGPIDLFHQRLPTVILKTALIGNEQQKGRRRVGQGDIDLVQWRTGQLPRQGLRRKGHRREAKGVGQDRFGIPPCRAGARRSHPGALSSTTLGEIPGRGGRGRPVRGKSPPARHSAPGRRGRGGASSPPGAMPRSGFPCRRPAPGHSGMPPSSVGFPARPAP